MVRQLREPGLYPDGGGLFMQVTTGVDNTPRRSWVLRYRAPSGRSREMGLGSALDVALVDARAEADVARKQVREGVDPIEERKLKRARAATDAAKAMTFRQCAANYIATHEAGWRNAKHAAQWSSTLDAYAHPVFGDAAVASIDVAMIMKALDPIWSQKTETASRVRQRIEAILDWATVRGYRVGDNPARWRGHLQKALPPRARVQKVRHHPALPYAELPAFVARLRAVGGLAPIAFEFLILTATRTNEALRAEWNEIDLDKAVWTIPGERMKAGREHRVPLSAQSVELLERLRLLGSTSWVFPGNGDSAPLSNMACLAVLKRMNRRGLTVHGFRSTFRDWTAEQTNYAREVAEAALAHVIGDKTEAAYRRGDLFEKRRLMMAEWAAFCLGAQRPASATAQPK
ncbi:MAG: tyrosine-type recombinase/integrase [Hyphomonadaceae bacterium]|nr:tyrosine-type recombinase/integrase [Hyphomonadaceae bacterium]